MKSIIVAYPVKQTALQIKNVLESVISTIGTKQSTNALQYRPVFGKQ